MAKLNLALTVVCFSMLFLSVAQASNFWDDFMVTFGLMNGNVKFPGPNVGDTVKLGLTTQTGSGFQSKYPFMFGRISMKIKLVGGNSAGTVTSYYMASTFKKWCELDFEFLGNVTGQPYILQTNVFVEGKGEREQRVYLWFDPTADYHEYGFLWNQNLILFLVDNRVIRVFYNQKNLGLLYPDYQPMYIYSSIFDGDSWATRGGREKINWAGQPFEASYTAFDVASSCQVKNSTGFTDIHNCYNKLYRSWYGQAPNLALGQTQINDLRWIRSQFLIYDYCTDLARWNGSVPLECAKNWP
ncbi:hypothetical protein R1flu_028677 [Riccia fluitans]|uniref:Xyloglucan endotransglucosylase/hydrolase n=1 Tax=Riccia fluitans TaxID=41844 RepID=A0ABD1XMD3_9MARC